MNDLTSQTREKMQKVLDMLRSDLATVRTGRAAPSLVENIVISAYGGSARLKVMELATISATDPHTLAVTPFDGSIIGEIQKGIVDSGSGLNPVIDGQLIRIAIPMLSEERRQELIKLMKQKLENGKIMVRQARHEAMEEVKKQYNDKTIGEDDMSRLEKEIQKVTDDTISQIDEMGKRKEEELMQI
ncbi:MAG: ribosome recycling factor [Candidatus Levyibacteriota bacterium]